MAATPIVFATKDNASGLLNAGINASVLSIPLQSGNGANFPQPYSGTTTSGGTLITLNCTGISATIGGSAQVDKWIWNKTDGSVAKITAVSTDALTTTPLLGGTDNLWDNGDTWCIDPFVATLAVLSTSAYGVVSITQYEEVLITARSTDTLTVPTGGRGYNSTTANTFSGGDAVYLFVTSPILERIKDVMSVMLQKMNINVAMVSAASSDVGTSSTAEAAMTPTYIGSATIPASRLVAGSTLQLRYSGIYSLLAGAFNINFYLGTKLIGSFSSSSTTSVKSWSAEIELDVRTGGATGTFYAGGVAVFSVSSSSSYADALSDTGGSATPGEQTSVDFTSALAITVKAQFDTSNGGNYCNIQTGSIKIF